MTDGRYFEKRCCNISITPGCEVVQINE